MQRWIKGSVVSIVLFFYRTVRVLLKTVGSLLRTVRVLLKTVGSLVPGGEVKPKTGACLQCPDGFNWTTQDRKTALSLNVNPTASGLDATVSVRLESRCTGTIAAGAFGTVAVFRRVVNGVPSPDIEVQLMVDQATSGLGSSARASGPLGMSVGTLFEGANVSAKVCGVDYVGDSSTLSFK